MLPGLSADFMASQYRAASHDIKIEYLRFFRRTVIDYGVVQRAVFENLTVVSNATLKKEIEHTIAVWIEKKQKIPVFVNE